MDQIIVKGGISLQGSIEISGAKNSALPIIAASILTKEKCFLENVPKLIDVKTIFKLLEVLGAKIADNNKGKFTIDPSEINNIEAPYDLVKTMRASVLVLGPLVARLGRARVSLPGGCAIGARPIDLHLKGLEALGSKIKIEHGYVNISAPKLKGAHIYLDLPTVTGTENILMAASMAEGQTVIENAACEPEVEGLANLLNSMGAKITGAGTDTIKIQGVKSLHSFKHSIIPDRIETGTFMIAAAITGGEVLIKNCIPKHVLSLILKLKDTGADVVEGDSWIKVRRNKEIKAVDVKTAPYPGFPTDMQAQIMSLLSIANGISVISETVFENRFMHIAELKRMGADISIEGNSAIIKGVKKLTGAPLMATDLRASACLILAGLVAEGTTTISRIYHIDRGYERIENKLKSLGANIERI
ncbi:MAG TPA: UDP-N-acetylglucosamine 1-carboxyvinyltransferase [Nitrospinota bacterium]|nr:UDP-N-acetylglucosamine 1-carboxyvinyltransferase [Nitrospinota bacterium]